MWPKGLNFERHCILSTPSSSRVCSECVLMWSEYWNWMLLLGQVKNLKKLRLQTYSCGPWHIEIWGNLLVGPFLLTLHADIWEDLEREFQISNLRELAFSSGGRVEPVSRLLSALTVGTVAAPCTRHNRSWLDRFPGTCLSHVQTCNWLGTKFIPKFPNRPPRCQNMGGALLRNDGHSKCH